MWSKYKGFCIDKSKIWPGNCPIVIRPPTKINLDGWGSLPIKLSATGRSNLINDRCCVSNDFISINRIGSNDLVCYRLREWGSNALSVELRCMLMSHRPSVDYQSAHLLVHGQNICCCSILTEVSLQWLNKPIPWIMTHKQLGRLCLPRFDLLTMSSM